MCGRSASLVRLVYILSFLPAAIQVNCDSTGECEGQRPRSSERCCPLLPGDQCGVGHNGTCDLELGYTCTNGICAGEYNLTVTDVGTTSASLSWLGFLPEESQFEYSVLYTRLFSQPLLRWNSHGVGTNNHVTLQYLTPDTFYFARVGVWTTEEKFENLTEVIFLHTTAAAHCVYNGRPIKVNERLVVECEESCVCHSTGRFECVPVCHGADTETPVCRDGQRDMCCESVTRCMFSNCTYLGDSVSHAQAWTIGCQENCTCYDGLVTCTPLCESSPKPDNCLKSSMVESEDNCCPTWRCDEPEDTCSFRNETYNEGTWLDGDCGICSCDSASGNVQCLDMQHCDRLKVPETSEACPDPTIINNVCCSQVFCEQNQNLDDLLEVFSVMSVEPNAMLVRFKLTSATNEADVISVSMTFTNHTNHVSSSNWRNVTFNLTHVKDISNTSVNFSTLVKSNSIYKVQDNILISRSNLDSNVFYFVKIRMEIQMSDEDGNQSVQTFASNTVVIKIHGYPQKHPDGVHSASRPRHDLALTFQTVNISSWSAVVTWQVPEAQQSNISWFVIRYKPLRDREWQTTKRLIFSERSYHLTCLFDSLWYQADLIAFPGEHRFGPTFFNTSEIKESPDERFDIGFKKVDIGTSTVTLKWDPIKDEYKDHVVNMQILFSVSERGGEIFKLCAGPGTSEYTIDSLSPGTMYLCWVRVNLHSGKSVFSTRVHFVTATSVKAPAHSTTSHRHSIILAITVACASLISIAVAIATIAYLTRCRKRASYQTQTSFENKIFQIYSSRDDRDV